MSQYYTISEQYHEKKGTYIYVLRLIKKVDKDEFSNLREYAKDYDGYYSSYRGVNGFVFQNEEDAESFGAIIDSYFGTSDIHEVVDETLEDTIEDVVSQKKPRSKGPRIPSSSAVSKKRADSVQMSSGMPLHIALRNIIQTDGNNIITELRLVNILDDFHAFDAIPATKYILRAVIADGFTAKLLAIGQWNNLALNLITKFSTITGFVCENVDLIFQSLAFGLGWKESVELLQGKDDVSPIELNEQETKGETSPKKKRSKKIKSVEKMTDDEFEDYIWSKIEWDHNIEQLAGVSFSNYQISSFNWYTGFKILFEIKGKIKTKHLSIKYTAYDANGRLRAHSSGFFVEKGKNGKIGEINVFYEKPLDTLGRVIFEGSYDFNF